MPDRYTTGRLAVWRRQELALKRTPTKIPPSNPRGPERRTPPDSELEPKLTSLGVGS